MANVLDKLKQWSEAEAKTQENIIAQQAQQAAATRRAYSNMMVYLKELKLHNVKNLDLAEQIYALSEDSVEKLNEMHNVLLEKLDASGNSLEAEELLQRTTMLQKQIGDLSTMLHDMYEKQEAANAEPAEPEDPVSQGITYEEFKEMQELWKQFEGQMENRFEGQEDRIKSIVVSEMMGIRSDLAETVRTEMTDYNTNVQSMNDDSKAAFEESLENHERSIKREVTAVREVLEDSEREHFNGILDELNNVKNVVKGYARTAMWASCLALIVLILDILILK